MDVLDSEDKQDDRDKSDSLGDSKANINIDGNAGNVQQANTINNTYNVKLDENAFGEFLKNLYENHKQSSQKTKEKTSSTLQGNYTSKEDLMKWIQNNNIQTQSFIVVLYFFPGNTFQFLENLSGEFEKIINSGAIRKPEPRLSMFSQDISLQLLIDEKIIVFSRSNKSSDAGTEQFESINLFNDKLYEDLSNLIIHNYSYIQIHQYILRWLIKQVQKQDQEILLQGATDSSLVKVQASLGLGNLAKNNFKSIEAQSITPWSTNIDPNVRLLVGWVLLGYFDESKNKEYWKTIETLLRELVLEGDYFKKWTAIASTTRLGFISSDQDDTSLKISLSVFQEIIEKDDAEDFFGVLNKCICFIYSISTHHAKTICLELANWITKKDKPSTVRTALKIFINLLNVKINADDTGSENDISLWDLCESESYVLAEAIRNLIFEILTDNRGSFVDKAISKLSLSLETTNESGYIPQKAIRSIFFDLKDTSVGRYIPKILGNQLIHILQ